MNTGRFRLAVFLVIVLLGCADKPTEPDLTAEDVVQYPGAPTITVKLTSRSPEKVEFYLESDIILPYDITVRASSQGTCLLDGKTHDFESNWFFESRCDDVGFEAEMKKGTVKKHFDICFLYKGTALVPRRLSDYYVEGETCIIKTLTLIIKPWPGTEPGAYNVGSPSRLAIK